jgi:penicillin-binding protein 1A
VGLQPIIDLAQRLGIRQSKLEAVPALALGTSPVTLLEMVSSYATIAAQGEYRKPIFVRRIEDRDGNVIADFGGSAPERAMSQQSALTLIDMLRGVVTRGTGAGVRSRFGIYGDVAGKTGTTQNNTDGWFIMMHPNLVAGARTGHNAALLVGDFFRGALDSKRLDAAALLPGGKRPEPRRYEEEAPEEEIFEEAPIELAPGSRADQLDFLQQPVPIQQEEAIEVTEPQEEAPPASNGQLPPAPIPPGDPGPGPAQP